MSQGIAYRAGLQYLAGGLPGSQDHHLVRYQGRFYCWLRDHYVQQSNEAVQSAVTRWLARNEGVRRDGDRPQSVSSSFVRDVMLALTAETTAIPDLAPGMWITNQPADAVGPFVSTPDGILDIGRMNGDAPSLLPASPDFFSLTALPHGPDAASGCPQFEAFLDDTFGGNDDIVNLVQEMYGYCLLPDCRYEAAFVMFGNGNTGKSTQAEILIAMLGSANVSAIPLDRLGERFTLPAMAGKLANIVLDTGEIEKSAEGLFKALVSGEPVPVEEKHLPVTTMRLTAKQIFVTNVLPRFHDTSEGVWRRLKIIPFDRVRPTGQRDPNLKVRLRSELPAITAWSLRGLGRLLQQGHFTSVQRSQDMLRRYREESNPIGLFLSAECLRDPNGRVGRKTLYQSYKVWAEENGHAAVSSTRFYREVEAIHPQPDNLPRDGRGGDRVFVGLQLHHRAGVYERLQVLSPEAAEAS